MVEFDWIGQVTDHHYNKIVHKVVTMLADQLCSQVQSPFQQDKSGWVPQLSRKVNRVMTILEMIEGQLDLEVNHSTAVKSLQKLCGESVNNLKQRSKVISYQAMLNDKRP